MVVIKTFDNPIEAHLLKAKLADEGISCFLRDEHTVSLNPLYNIAVGGIKVQVIDEDYEKSKQILDEIDRLSFTHESGEIVKCPVCQSSHFYSAYKSMKGFKGFLAILVTILFGVYPIFFNTVNKCKDCQNEF